MYQPHPLSTLKEFDRYSSLGGQLIIFWLFDAHWEWLSQHPYRLSFHLYFKQAALNLTWKFNAGAI